MTLDDLTAYGANTEEGLVRCMGMEALYLRLAETIKTEPHFAQLHEALDAGDYKAAFEAAHALKGVLGNLSITPLFEPVSELVELLRVKADADYPALLEPIVAKWNEFLAL